MKILMKMMSLILLSLFFLFGGRRIGGRGEEEECSKVIVMGNVLGVADRSQGFASFLTITRNIRCSCIYNFHVIYPEKSVWK